MLRKDDLFRAGTGLHKAILRATGGRVLGRLGGMPVLLLTTTGRKTGAKRTTVLTTPVYDGDEVVLVASNGGDDRHPVWFLNLQENPDVTIEMGRRVRPMRARVVTGAERDELWPAVVAAYGGYDSYRQRTEREIPVIVLAPRG